MLKPKVKKKRGYWLVYTNKKQAFKCFSKDSINLYYNVLLKEVRQ